MVSLHELTGFCEETLQPAMFDDYCPNGLQVEAGEQVGCLVSGVTASMALIDAAVEGGADALLVHHGYFWRGEPAPLTGMKGARVRRLMQAGISLLAYHLPLDAHPQIGNNARLGGVLGFLDAHALEGHQGLLWVGETAEPMPAGPFVRQVGAALGREPLHIAGDDRPISRVAWCTGGAQGMIETAAAAGVDAYLTGEVSEQTTHQARELGLHFLACGHHATERYGVQALGGRISERFGIEHRFLDIDNPV